VDGSIVRELKKLEKYVYGLDAARRLNTLSSDERDIMVSARNSVYMARLDAQRAASTDEAREQIQDIERAVEQLDVLQECLSKASQHDLLTAADAAVISSLAEQSREVLSKIISE
jgi:hypothetical protein